MGQAELIGGALAGGFILYLAMNQRLGVYWSLIMGGGATASPPAAPAAPASGAPTTDPMNPLQIPRNPFISPNPLQGLPGNIPKLWNPLPPSDNPGSQPAGP